MSNFQKSAKKYIDLGYSVLPIEPRGKKPHRKYAWDKQSLTTEQLENYPSICNVGVILGERSGGLIDVDLDTPEAIIIGNKLFPSLAGFGRPSAPRSHLTAICPNPKETKKRSLTEKESKAAGFQDDEKIMIVELRANGAYTVFPSSTHSSGEPIEWSNGLPENMPVMEWDELIKRVDLCAFLAIALKMYPKIAGMRDTVCMALTGALLRAGWPSDMVDDLVVYIAEQSGDEEAHTRAKAAATQENWMPEKR